MQAARGTLRLRYIVSDIDHYLRNELRPRHLRMLAVLADVQNVGKAAAQLNVSQPALSKALAEVEKGLGLRLFDRTPRGMRPTNYGECLIRHAKQLLSAINTARQELHDLEAGEQNRVIVGVLSNVVPVLLPRAVALVKARAPNVNVVLREGTMEQLLPHLALSEVDVIVGRPPERHWKPWLGEKVIATEPVVLIGRADHPLTGREGIDWPELLRYSWVLPAREGLLREPLERIFEAHGVPMPKNYVDALSVQFVLSFLQLTTAIATMTRDLARHYQAQGQIRILPFEFPLLARPLGITWNQQRPVTETMSLFISCVEESIAGGTPA